MTTPSSSSPPEALVEAAVLLRFAHRVQELAFSMPAPNEYTPQFVQLAQAATLHALKADERAALSAIPLGEIVDVLKDSSLGLHVLRTMCGKAKMIEGADTATDLIVRLDALVENLERPSP